MQLLIAWLDWSFDYLRRQVLGLLGNDMPSELDSFYFYFFQVLLITISSTRKLHIITHMWKFGHL